MGRIGGQRAKRFVRWREWQLVRAYWRSGFVASGNHACLKLERARRLQTEEYILESEECVKGKLGNVTETLWMEGQTENTKGACEGSMERMRRML